MTLKWIYRRRNIILIFSGLVLIFLKIIGPTEERYLFRDLKCFLLELLREGKLAQGHIHCICTLEKSKDKIKLNFIIVFS